MSERLWLQWSMQMACITALTVSIVALTAFSHRTDQRNMARVDALKAGWAMQVEQARSRAQVRLQSRQDTPELQDCVAARDMPVQGGREDVALAFVHSSGIACYADDIRSVDRMDIERAARALASPNDPPPTLALDRNGRLALYRFARRSTRAPDPGLWMVMAIVPMDSAPAAMTRAFGTPVFLVDHHGKRMAGDQGALWDRLPVVLDHGRNHALRVRSEGRDLDVVATPIRVDGAGHYGHVAMLRDVSPARGEPDPRVWWFLLLGVAFLAMLLSILVTTERTGRPFAHLLGAIRRLGGNRIPADTKLPWPDPDAFPAGSALQGAAKAIAAIRREREHWILMHDARQHLTGKQADALAAALGRLETTLERQGNSEEADLSALEPDVRLTLLIERLDTLSQVKIADHKRTDSKEQERPKGEEGR